MALQPLPRARAIKNLKNLKNFSARAHNTIYGIFLDSPKDESVNRPNGRTFTNLICAKAHNMGKSYDLQLSNREK